MNLDKNYIEKNFNLHENGKQKSLNLQKKQINSISENTFDGLVDLIDLWMSFNQIKTLNYNVFSPLVSLKYLMLDNNQIKNFESAFNGLESLEHLDLSSNEITKFNGTNTFKELKSLKNLKLESNKITGLNKEMFNCLENLQHLNLRLNLIDYLSQNIFKNLKSLVFLSIQSNKIKRLNANVFNGLGNLELLDLSYNYINEIDSKAFNALIKLNKLNLEGNQIKCLNPNTFESNENLTQLELSYNQISELKSGSFFGLQNLERLYLFQNKIVEIYAGAFNGLEHLKHLYLHDNQLVGLKNSAFKGLEQLLVLDLSRNCISEFDVNVFSPLKKLSTLHLNSNKIKILETNTFFGMDCLSELYLNENEIQTISDESFNGLFSLKNLYAQNNQIKRLNQNSLAGLLNLDELHLNYNQLEVINDKAFQCLAKIRKLVLSSNKISCLDKKTFAGLTKLEELEMEKNQLTDLDERLFANLKLITLYLHPISFNLKPKVFTNMFNQSLSLINLTLFDEFILYKPNFKHNKNPIMPGNLTMYFGKRFENPKLNTEFFLSSNSLVSLKLSIKNYKSIKSDFKWKIIARKLAVITGLNGVGKTTLLKLINESLSQEENKELSDYCVVKYFNTAENKFTFNQIELNNFNKILNENINDFLFSISNYWSHFLYDNINYFSLIQYFDYLVSINDQFDEFMVLNEKLFKYKFDEKRVQQRKNQQNKFRNKFEEARSQIQYRSNQKNKQQPIKSANLNYYDGIRPIEYYLGLDEDHKMSPGESLILLFELWRLHAKHLKKENQIRPFRTKLRIVLLDEPDCFMHPSLIKEFFRLLTNNDLNYLKFQVIMTTHNPVSVSLVPIENIFEMKCDQQTGRTEVNKIENRSQLIRGIAEDLVFIKEKFKIVFIEGESGGDEAFYSFINSKINRGINIPIKFQEMGSKKFNQIFVKNLLQDPSHKLDEFIFGINDGDYKIPNAYRYFGLKDKYFKEKYELNSFQANFRRLERYSFENYVFDPVNLCFAIKFLVKQNVISLKKKSKNNMFLTKVLSFLDSIKAYENIDQFIRADKQRAKESLNDLLKTTAEFYMKKVDRNHLFFETFDLKICSDNELESRLMKTIKITFADYDNFNLDYFPIILYFPGKFLRGFLLDDLLNFNCTHQNFIKILLDIFREKSGFLCDKSLYNIIENIHK